MRVYEVIAGWLASINKYVFTVAAENILGLLRSLIDRGGGFVVNSRFEPSAGFMALVSSRLLLRPGLLVLTAGPGVFGALSPIAEAFVEGDPLIVIAPSVVGGRGGTHMHQLRGDAQFNALNGVVKASFRLSGVGGISETLIKAYRVAVSGKPGPVYVEVPLSVLDSEIEVTPVDISGVGIERPMADDSVVREIAKILADAELPVLLLGRGVLLSGAKELAIKVAEVLNAPPVATTIMAKGLVSPPNHPLYAGVAAGKAGNMVAYEVIKRLMLCWPLVIGLVRLVLVGIVLRSVVSLSTSMLMIMTLVGPMSRTSRCALTRRTS